ncbi:unnamed protein product [Caenorhabditis auriculariae]|uniref:FUN14 domain-containing protein 1 n=1 Tax=Caenorhabditis auriculariae TaxID=2777116 RepID=A0A8S1HJI7_9PELO|nr:unnamed protein product [Caenorhabditis auriculariae]
MAVSKPADYLNSAINYVDDLHRRPPLVQVAVGGGVGVTAGYIATRVSKAVATTIGVSFLLLQFAVHRGYIAVNHDNVGRDIAGLKKSLRKRVNDVPHVGGDEVQNFVVKNSWTFSGFAAGVLIGFGLA